MKVLTLVSLLLLRAVVASATTTLGNLTVPACGSTCIYGEAAQSACSISNITCICTNSTLKAKIQTCILSNCSIREALREDRTGLVWHLGLAFMIIGLVAFFIRCLERLRARTWGMDDSVISVVAAILIPMGALTIPLSNYGLGLDMWNVSSDDINSILYHFYWEEILYAVALGLNKISILFFYLRVFPQTSFRVAVYILLGLNAGYAIAYSLAVVFQCSPIEGAWRAWDGEYTAECVNINYLGWSGAAVNIALDIATLILPMYLLVGLTMSIKKKIQIIAMFMVGFFVTLVSILRLRSLIEFGSTKNVTQDYVEVGYWSTIEISIGIVCACMPAIRALLSKVFPLVFGSQNRTTRGPQTYPYTSAKSGISHRLFNSKSSAAIGPNEKGEAGGMEFFGVKRKPKFSKYGTSNEITVQNEWTVAGHTANRSDVELVALEKKLPFRGGDTGYVGDRLPDQWSGENDRAMVLPIQGHLGGSL
ncbi:uncharacterized protein JN550_000176 [Neoarthrinium moseri]|uniref:uncharacterized protein n=1 Tax=Neoarthrinium moseri TaxID=1658444 RepID=UPI001FDCB881|nr:uncharacterized protein JN550_000176 [Neoarthrinium moseri]KAI1877994.1 hypothetical protein JN550_000176 [Neoarthrinium moseri]